MKTRGNCKHDVWIDVGNLDDDRHVFMANDDDPFYIQQFRNSPELLAFVGQLLKAHDEAFGTEDKVTRLLTMHPGCRLARLEDQT